MIFIESEKVRLSTYVKKETLEFLDNYIKDSIVLKNRNDVIEYLIQKYLPDEDFKEIYYYTQNEKSKDIKSKKQSNNILNELKEEIEELFNDTNSFDL